MYKIQKTEYGIRLQFGGILEVPELRSWLRASAEMLESQRAPFSVLIDMRTLGPLDHEGKVLMTEGQEIFRSAGMERSVVILENPVTLMQFKRIAHESGIYEWERYISAIETPEWEQVALDWLQNGVDPGKRLAKISELG